MQLETKMGLIVLSKTARESEAAGAAAEGAGGGGEGVGSGACATGAGSEAAGDGASATGAAAGRGVARAAPTTTATTAAGDHGRINWRILPHGPAGK
jgi:hypothetical protein